MNPLQLRFRSLLPAQPADVYDWHAREGAFERLTPPWQRLETIDHRGGIEEGAWRLMRLWLGPTGLNWLALHRENEHGHFFIDEQVYGPFAAWRHVHRFEPVGRGRTILTDDLALRLPLGQLTHPLLGGAARAMLRSMFSFRHLRTRMDIERHQSAGADRALRVTVLGEGLISKQLAAFLSAGGHVVEAPPSPRGARRFDAVVDLEGHTPDGRTATSLGDDPGALPGLAGFDAPVVVRVSQRADEPLHRRSVVAAPRVVELRTGAVLTAAGEPLRSWIKQARFGLPVAHPDDTGWVEWIALDDLLGAILSAITDETARGEIDLTSGAAISAASLNATLQSILLPAALLARFRTSQDQTSPPAERHTAHVSRATRLSRFHIAFPDLERLVRFETGRA